MTGSQSTGSIWRAVAELVRAVEISENEVERRLVLQKLNELLESMPRSEVMAALSAAEPASMSAPAVVRARDYLDSHASDRVSLRHVSRVAGLSVRQLTAHFRSTFGVTTHQYLTRRRLMEAIRLLSRSDLKISAIAAAVGFGNPSTLYRHFAERLATTPGTLRANRDHAAAALRQLEVEPPFS